MSVKKLIAASVIAGSVALAVAGATTAQANKGGMSKEKCFGVVKAGHNDCAAVDKSHSCMAQATVDGSPGEFIAVPKGMCEKLVGGILGKMTEKDAMHDHSDM